MAQRKKVFTPTENSEFIPYTDNVDGAVNAGGVGGRYPTVWTVAEIALAAGFKANIPTAISAAFAASQTAQSLNQTKDSMIHDCVLFNKRKGREMQDVSATVTDMELMGYFVNEVPPDPLTAKPRIVNIVSLPDMIVMDWIRGFWKGVVIYASTDGVTYTRIDKDFRSPFEDKRFNAAVNVPEVRWYKLRYLDANENIIGDFSDPVKAVAEIYQP